MSGRDIFIIILLSIFFLPNQGVYCHFSCILLPAPSFPRYKVFLYSLGPPFIKYIFFLYVIIVSLSKPHFPIIFVHFYYPVPINPFEKPRNYPSLFLSPYLLIEILYNYKIISLSTCPISQPELKNISSLYFIMNHIHILNLYRT